MRHSELIELARATAFEADERGFPQTAAAMREVVKTMIAVDELQLGSEAVKVSIGGLVAEQAEYEKFTQMLTSQVGLTE